MIAAPAPGKMAKYGWFSNMHAAAAWSSAYTTMEASSGRVPLFVPV
jgi:hypothetical protein